MVTFGEPTMLWLLLLPATGAAAALLRHRLRGRQQRRLASPGVWRRVMGGAPATGLLRMLAWCAAGAMIAVGLARPQWCELPGEESVRTRDLVVAIDVSDSMLCPDIRPSRLGRSLDVVKRALAGLSGNRLGVVVFAGDAYPLVPLTTDLAAVAVFLDGVQPGMVALPGSNIEHAVAAALKLLPPEGEGRVVVLISDGENLQGSVERAAGALREAGVGVLGLVAGTTSGGPIPMPSPDGGVQYKRDAEGQPVVTRAHPEVIGTLAQEAGGEVLDLGDQEVVRRLLEIVQELRTRELEANRTVHRVERFPIFLLLAAALLALSFALSPWRRVAAAAALGLSLLAAPASAQDTAASSADAGARPAAPVEKTVEAPWWQRLVPGGSRRLARSGAASWRAGDYDEAVRDFAAAVDLDPEASDRLFDLGTALASAGGGDAADDVFERAHAAGAHDAAFNGGTASLLDGRAERAVEWLRQALLEAPGDPDAKRNYELALQLLQQQQQQQQQDQQDQQQQEQQQEQQSSQQTPTPSADGAAPTPTPVPPEQQAIFEALDRAEADAREEMRSPTPRAPSVEKDW